MSNDIKSKIDNSFSKIISTIKKQEQARELLILSIMSTLGAEKVEIRVSEIAKHYDNNNHINITKLENGNLLYEIEYGDANSNKEGEANGNT